jgi:CMP-N-acetylneuraminic acid synthetase
MRTVGIIPARGGSKRLPDKNLAPLAGRPLIGHTCQAALGCGVLDAVFCNTDSPAIADAARQLGVAVPTLRPAELATDDSPVRLAIAWMLQFLADRGRTFDAVVLLQPTSPLRSEEDIRQALVLFEQHAPCAVVSVTQAYPPIEWHRWCDASGLLNPIVTRRPAEHRGCRLNGAVYVHPPDHYLANRPPNKEVAYWMPPERSVDVDYAHDMVLAEHYLQEQMQTK